MAPIEQEVTQSIEGSWRCLGTTCGWSWKSVSTLVVGAQVVLGILLHVQESRTMGTSPRPGWAAPSPVGV